MPVYQFVLAMVLALYVGFARLSIPAALGFKMGMFSGLAAWPDRFVLRLRAMVRSPRLDIAEGGGPGRAKTVLS